MSERYLKYKQYRNIAIDVSDTKDEKKVKLILNTSIRNLGELVVLIGPNNVGKSNILRSLNSLNQATLSTKLDKPSFYEYDKAEPEICLVYNENKYKCSYFINEKTNYYEHNLNGENIETKITVPQLVEKIIEFGILILNHYLEELSHENRNHDYQYGRNISQLIINAQNAISFFQNISDFNKYILHIDENDNVMFDLKGEMSTAVPTTYEAYLYLVKSGKYQWIKEKVDSSDEHIIGDEYISIRKMFANLISADVHISNIFTEKYGFNIVPKVYEFIEPNFNINNLTSRIDNDILPTNCFNIFLKTLFLINLK
ncbi:hypothetical protein SCLARK_001244 [Spiroplasma clarkii]|uniref:ATP-binding protein n=1 Tax=Spiroplasma clarkii TaxID=2139 RepID=UPI000B56FEAC|nr:ATP-binding protein [Spiroplasma clarkii]ARU91794.1 hypothetical protein SCLARK_001244 [Spiroplasma clarkii]